MKQRFEITEQDLVELMDLSRKAASTPVMTLSVADGLAGRDFASMARERVYAKWREIGKRMGFDGMSVEPVPGQGDRMVLATPTTPESEQP